MLRTVARAAVLAVALGVGGAGCAAPLRGDPPGPGVPRIANLEFQPSRTVRGCAIQVTFCFEDSDGDLVGATAHWVLVQSNKRVASGRSPLPADRSALEGKVAGELVAAVTIEQHGTYWYRVQAEDAAGHRSNVLERAIAVDGPLPWRSGSDRCPR